MAIGPVRTGGPEGESLTDKSVSSPTRKLYKGGG